MDTLNPATLLSGRYRPEKIPDLTGKTAVVTGGSAGIGYYDALALALAGAKVLIVSASEAHGKQAEAEIANGVKEKGSKGSIQWYGVDLGNLKQVDELVKKIAEQESSMDIVILNAGVGQAPYALTHDGLENHFAVNNLSHYVIGLRLLPLVKKTAAESLPTTVRIVTQSSELHRMAPSDTKFATKEEINEKRDVTIGYGRSKVGNIFFTKGLVKRHLSDNPKKILSLSVHPGTVNTDIQKGPGESGAYGPIFGKAYELIMRTVGKSAEEGAEASLWAATSTDINESNWQDYQGGYYTEPFGSHGNESALAQDDNVADNFWEFCAARTKEILGEELR